MLKGIDSVLLFGLSLLLIGSLATSNWVLLCKLLGAFSVFVFIFTVTLIGVREASDET